MGRVCILAFLIVCLTGVGTAQLGELQKSAPEVTPEPYTLPEVLDALAHKRNVQEMIRNRHVNFDLNPGTEKLLRDFGASPALLEMIRSAAPPRAASTSDLLIKCEPVDCVLAVNQHLYGNTENKVKRIQDFPPGNVTIEVFANYFESDSRKIALKKGEKLQVSFTLRPTDLYQRYRAQDLFLRALNALGGSSGMSDLQKQPITAVILPDERAAGSWRFSIGPVSGGWSLSVVDSKAHCSALFSMDSFKFDCKGRNSPPESVFLLAAQLFRDANFPSIFDRIYSKPFTVAETADGFVFAGEDLTLRTNRELLPVEAITVNPPERIKFDNITSVAAKHYPARMTVDRNASRAIFDVDPSGPSTTRRGSIWTQRPAWTTRRKQNPADSSFKQ